MVEQDAMFYSRSSGGMTLSGGEPLMQGDFALALLREARRRRIKTAVETCGMVPWKTMEAASEYLNYVLYDIKHMDSAAHEEHTCCPNTTILDNFRRLAEMDPERPHPGADARHTWVQRFRGIHCRHRGVHQALSQRPL